MQAVTITGYYSTGSGAVIDLLREYSSIYDGNMARFEHLFLYDVDGVFDTVDKILYGNNLFNSNAAITRFRAKMRKLNNVDFGWFGGYRYRCSDQFRAITERFIREITEYHSHREWYGCFEGRKITANRLLRDTGAFILKGRVPSHNFGSEIRISTNGGEYSFADEAKLSSATKRLVEDYIRILYPDAGDRIVLLNHMLLAQDAYRLPQYMPDDLKLIIVDRDVRDLYISNKYVWKTWGVGSLLPTEMEPFVAFMKGYRRTERPIENSRILRVQFEDLIYQTEKTTSEIERFLGLNPADHVLKEQRFAPQKSIKNTQLFLIKPEWEREVEPLSELLPEYIYSFPYKNSTSVSETFDG